MRSADTILVGRDHTLGGTLDVIAQHLLDQGKRVIRLPELQAGKHSQIPLAESDRYLSNITIIVVSSRTLIDSRVLAAAPNLKAVIFPSIGYNSCDIEAAAHRGVRVVNGVTSENYESMAEATAMLMAVLMLELGPKQDWLRQGRPTPTSLSSQMLKGRVIGMIGYGRIAQETIKRLQGWGIGKFLLYTRTAPTRLDSRISLCTLEEVLRESDLVSIHCPLNDHTRLLIGQKELRMMKATSYLINTSRGGIVDESALYEALRDKTIAAAAIDTFAEEPLCLESPLRSLQNVILTQHNIGHTRDLFDSLVPKALANIDEVIAGRIPKDTVNLDLLSDSLRTGQAQIAQG